MPAKYPNFYENLKEAHLRLLRTIITYDGDPYWVWSITDHKKDGIFRIYLMPLNIVRKRCGFDPSNFQKEDPNLGILIDEFLEKNPGLGILRKKMDSPLFNKFRPFPMGMCNHNSSASYLARQPQRHTEQGLTVSMVDDSPVSLSSKDGANYKYRKEFDLYSDAFVACVRGDHPSAEDCLQNLKDPTIKNEAVAFHRQFALVRGPVGLLFLAYKENVIGTLPKTDFSEVKLGKEHSHCKEVVSELGLFGNVILS